MGQSFPKPLPTDNYTPANVPVITYYGGAYGDQETQSTSNVTNDFAPKTQADKAAIVGGTLAKDIGTPQGAIAPNKPYAPPPASPAGDPKITTLAPNTAVAGSSPAIQVLVTGSNFSEWSTVKTGGVPTPYYRVLSPTQIVLTMDPKRSVAGVVGVVVSDHGVDSAASNFTFT